jgi:hypothetical protein
MPFRDECADLLCFAQSWHWLDQHRRAGEAARVLRKGGRWAAWWSHARVDGEPWFEAWWQAGRWQARYRDAESTNMPATLRREPPRNDGSTSRQPASFAVTGATRDRDASRSANSRRRGTRPRRR